MAEECDMTDRQVEIEGFIAPADIITPETIAYVKKFPVRDDDVFNITYPKSGTTWMQEILTLIMNDGDVSKVADVPNYVRAPLLELETAPGYMDNRPSPRVASCHVYATLAPAGIMQGKGKVVYTYRNPKDVIISFYHFHELAKFLPTPESFESFLSDFMNEKLSFGCWFKHVKSWMDTKGKANIMFVAFEDLHSDLAASVTRIANFLDKKLDADALKRVVDHCSFASMKKNDMVNYKTIPTAYFDNKRDFMRKGILGDWKSMFTPELNEKFEAYYREKMKGYDFEPRWSFAK